MTDGLARKQVAWSLEQIAAARAALPGDTIWLDSARGTADLGERSLVALELAPLLRATVDAWTLFAEDGSVRREGAVTGDAARQPWRRLDAELEGWRSAAPGDPLGFVVAASWEAAALCDAAIPVHRPGEDQAAQASRTDTLVLRVDRVLCGVVERDGERVLVARGRDAAEANERAARWIDALRRSLTPSEATTEATREVNGGDDAIPDQGHTLSLLHDQDRAHHERRVQAVVEAIHAGRVFQACLTYPLLVRRPACLLPLYRRLRANGPTDYGGWLRWGELEAAMASPERFLSFRDRVVRARPMKGTRPRTLRSTPADELDGVDVQSRDELAASPKDRAENVMIVDLLRNDLGRVCAIGSVHVPALFTIETYGTVHQMTSTVEGTLRDDVGVFEAFAACFPPGSMSGAPKVEACALIAELERGPRGLYAGSVGWVGCDGRAEFNVVIRSLVATGDVASWSVGGGIVADSTGAGEWLESRAKLAALEAVTALVPRDRT